MKKIFITGISKGIGRSIAEKLSKQSECKVIGSCRNPNILTDKLDGVEYLALDLSNSASIKACAEKLQDIDIMINNAGQSQIGAVEEVSMDKIRGMYDINLFGNIELIQGVIGSMRQKRQGMIINIGSMTGSFALPLYSSYCASKAAFQMFSLCIRQELSQFGITVVHIEPNDIKTTITPDLIYKEGGAYEQLAKTVREQVRLKMAKAEDPEIVANLVTTIIHSKKPKARYTVGGNGNFLVFMKRFVSDRFIEKSTMKLYGL
jgi:NAD(P)-dependent dehydrogenase (short-subunit alcohol dehydrogenase family)